ncbi:hypothetical protein [Pseudarthrobacter sulfonivorans]|uniref:hypothetical protein n=1 Tax=Pseudarthrobacter sulfonivorans TaxID=121292 RepID=UPI00286D5834|nr:hypothetical protein [Pseudarthrobacter sulfonivorans]
MKNLGISSRVLLLALLAGLWAWTVASASGSGHTGSGHSQEGSDSPIQDHPERGDVPGWVMITLMSAVLVAALLALAGPALETMFNQAMDKVGK